MMPSGSDSPAPSPSLAPPIQTAQGAPEPSRACTVVKVVISHTAGGETDEVRSRKPNLHCGDRAV